MTEKENGAEDRRIRSLVRKLIDDLDDNLSKEKDTSIILLKGHLLIEGYLKDLLLLNKKQVQVDKLSFSQKVKELSEPKLLGDNIIKALNDLNATRNNLAHALEFNVTSSDIDQIGHNFGREYVLEKYKHTEKDTRTAKILRWVIEQIATEVFVTIIRAVIKEEKSKK